MTAKTLVILVAGLAASLVGASAWAASAGDAPSLHVAYTDLDLTRDAGVEKLYGRLRLAAEAVCGNADIRELKAHAAHQACTAQALDAAVGAIRSDRLSTRHSLGTTASRVAMGN